MVFYNQNHKLMSSPILQIHPRCFTLVNTSEHTLWRIQAQLLFNRYKSKLIASEDIGKVERIYLVFNIHSNHHIIDSFALPVASG